MIKEFRYEQELIFKQTTKVKICIDKCICFDTTFQEMKDLMIEKNLKTLEELQLHKPVSLNCKLCLPYILEMIQTGKTEFNEILQN